MRVQRRILFLVALTALALALLVPAVLPEGRAIVLATTTSTEDSGLLGFLLPRFTQETGIHVRVIAVGTGQALELGRRGDADVVLTHAPAKEAEFNASGHAAYRLHVMYNQFVLLGPPGDPAGVAGGTNISFAMAALAQCRCTFLSRGDDSGTHTKELELWRLAGSAPTPNEWYREAGQGMGATLRIADQLGAYTLSDDGTYFTMARRLDLVVIVENDPRLRNQYSVMPVDPSVHPGVRFADADAFAQWLTGAQGQALIGSYTVGGRTIFTPNAGG